ncbi:MAG: hypothetical protein JWP57_239 [Spirosoma sp.]|nr:hypothetical protein [Spirosoma sp.]
MSADTSSQDSPQSNPTQATTTRPEILVLATLIAAKHKQVTQPSNDPLRTLLEARKMLAEVKGKEKS